MRRAWILALCLLVAAALTARAQESDVVGRWMVEKQDAIVEIEVRDGEFAGTIVWAQDRDGIRGDEHLDAKNPEPELRDRKVLGSEILTGLPTTPTDDGWYGNGRVYNPKSGKTYPVKLRLESADVLRLRIGGKIVGKTIHWTRVKE